MTDNDVIKALECCLLQNHKECPYDRKKELKSECEFLLIKDCASLINRQQAEIERLTGLRNSDPMDFCGVLCKYSEELIIKAKSEARKEFAERVRFEIINKPSEFNAAQATVDFLNGSSHRQHEILDIIDNLLAEMDGKENGNENN